MAIIIADQKTLSLARLLSLTKVLAHDLCKVRVACPVVLAIPPV
ncbi:hypothetical protein [Agrobacterium rubi]|jgi:hypothetical protein|nr:hypothetical protein [Agrobacterium rubi]